MLEELEGSLQTYISILALQNKGESITLKIAKKELDYSSNGDLNSEDITLVTRKFRKTCLR